MSTFFAGLLVDSMLDLHEDEEDVAAAAERSEAGTDRCRSVGPDVSMLPNCKRRRWMKGEGIEVESVEVDVGEQFSETSAMP